MKLLILSNSINGLLSFRQEVIKALIEEYHEVIVSAPSSNQEDEVRALGCKLITKEFRRKGTNPLEDLKLLFYYVRLIKKIKPDVVLTYTIKPNVYGGIASRITGVPVIANITGLGSAVENEGWLQKLTITLYNVALKRAACIFFQNEFNRDFFSQRIFQPCKYKLIPGSGVNLTKHVQKEYPEEGDLQFVFVSRILKEKGIEEYLYVAENIKKEYPEAIFHIVGSYDDDSYKNTVADYQQRDIVNYHGLQKDVRPFLAQCCCTIHPSYYPEGMSNVCLETQATGRPVITTDRVGCQDTVEDGVTGFIVGQRDKEELLTAVKRFLSLPYADKRRMGIKARKRMECLFDRTLVVEAYLREIHVIGL